MCIICYSNIKTQRRQFIIWIMNLKPSEESTTSKHINCRKISTSKVWSLERSLMNWGSLPRFTNMKMNKDCNLRPPNLNQNSSKRINLMNSTINLIWWNQRWSTTSSKRLNSSYRFKSFNSLFNTGKVVTTHLKNATKMLRCNQKK